MVIIDPCSSPPRWSAPIRSRTGWSIARGCRKMVPRVRAKEMWRGPQEILEAAQDEATLLAIRDQERAGLDIISDGENGAKAIPTASPPRLRRRHENPGTTINRSGRPIPVPRVTGKISRKYRSRARPAIPARQHGQAGEDDGAGTVHHGEAGTERVLRDDQAMTMDYAAAVNEEMKDLSPPAPTSCKSTSLICRRTRRGACLRDKAIDRALEGVPGTAAVHICFGYAHIVHPKPPAYRSCPNSRTPRSRDIDRGGAPASISRCWKGCRKKHHPRRHRSLHMKSKRRKPSRPAFAARRLCGAGPDRRRARLRHEICRARWPSAKTKASASWIVRREMRRQPESSPLPAGERPPQLSGAAGEGSYCFELTERQLRPGLEYS